MSEGVKFVAIFCSQTAQRQSTYNLHIVRWPLVTLSGLEERSQKNDQKIRAPQFLPKLLFDFGVKFLQGKRLIHKKGLMASESDPNSEGGFTKMDRDDVELTRESSLAFATRDMGKWLTPPPA